MWIFNSIMGKIFEILFIPFRSMNPWVAMIVVSFLTAILMLLVYRYTSNQEGIKKVKNRIKAHLLEIRLYKDSMSISLKAQGKIVLANFKYIALNFKPLLVMIIPIILIIIQINFWFGYDSLKSGQPTLLKVKLAEGYNPIQHVIALEPSPEVNIETDPLRIEEDYEVNWRISPQSRGNHDLNIVIGSQSITKSFASELRALSRISPIRYNHHFLNNLLYPVEKPIEKDIPVKSIEVIYPARYLNLFGFNVHWLIAFFALSIIFGFAFKGFMKVEI
jgi:uncharacterized membrane protein (DUF106 family)